MFIMVFISAKSCFRQNKSWKNSVREEKEAQIIAYSLLKSDKPGLEPSVSRESTCLAHGRSWIQSPAYHMFPERCQERSLNRATSCPWVCGIEITAPPPPQKGKLKSTMPER